MHREPKTMRDVHAIQERLHNERQSWSDEELLEKYRRKALDAAKERGLRIDPLPEDARERRVG